MNVHPQIATYKFDGHLVVLPKESNKILLFDPLACWIWESLCLNRSVFSITDMLAETYGLDFSQTEIDVTAIVNQWRGAGFIYDDRPRELDLSDWRNEVPELATNPDGIDQLPARVSRAFRIHNSTFIVSTDIVTFAQKFFAMLEHLGCEPLNDVPDFYLYLDGGKFVGISPRGQRRLRGRLRLRRTGIGVVRGRYFAG